MINIPDHLTDAENLNTINTLDAAGIDHKVIALLMRSESMDMQASNIHMILNSDAALAEHKL